MSYRNFISIYQYSNTLSSWKKRGKNYLTEVITNTPYGIFFTGFPKDEYAIFCIRHVSCNGSLKEIATDKRYVSDFFMTAYTINPRTTYLVIKVKGSLKIVFSQESFFCQKSHPIPVPFFKLHVTPKRFADLNHSYLIKPSGNLSFFEIEVLSKMVHNKDPTFNRAEMVFLRRSQRKDGNVPCCCKYLRELAQETENEKIPDFVQEGEKELYTGEDDNFLLESYNESYGFNPVVFRQYDKSEFATLLRDVDLMTKIKKYCDLETCRITEPLLDIYIKEV